MIINRFRLIITDNKIIIDYTWLIIEKVQAAGV